MQELKEEKMNSNNLNNKEQDLKEFLRPEVKAISPYEGEKDDFEVKINLSGNESPFDLPQEIKDKFKEEFDQHDINRYPEIYSERLQQTLADYLSSELEREISTEEVLVGNGSDEILDILIRSFVEPGNVVLSQTPTFSMYKYFTKLSGGQYEEIPLDDEFKFKKLKDKIDKLKPKLIFLCSPNNPTGEIIERELILKLVDYFAGPVIIDEAYADFNEIDLMSDVKDYPNLAVIRTFSKAFGLAGIRFGYLYGNKVLVEELKKVLKPYNLNSLTDILTCLILDNNDIIKERIEFIKKERQKLYQNLNQYQNWKLYPSMANFIYIEGDKTEAFKKILNKQGIKIRSYTAETPAIRITIGSSEENEAVLRAFAEFKEQN
ncbi:MAG: histidinol-phosphate aminotransferase [Halanaerobium sp. T82-1]|jgi:histidinol-phosphate aminotransferase|nr:MAG: histidinol-phosphate aminotransferase [Halanaerobium sp. T82-1]